MFEPVSVPLAVRLVPHDLAQAQRGQHGAHPLHASADGPRDIAGAHLFIVREQLNDREGYRISEQAAETRLPVAPFFHAAPLSRFRNSENMKI
ncbi:MAG: hypothetical protein ACREBU_19595 [Nitrososphaera sp.]